MRVYVLVSYSIAVQQRQVFTKQYKADIDQVYQLTHFFVHSYIPTLIRKFLLRMCTLDFYGLSQEH